MSIFGAMDIFCGDKIKVPLEAFRVPVGKLANLVEKVRNAIDLIDKILDALNNNLKVLETAAGNAAVALRYNPLGSGPLKIVLKLIARFLRAAESMLRGLGNLVKTFKTIFNGSLRNKLEKAAEDLLKKIDKVITIIGDIRVIANKIQGIARKLAQQEHLLKQAEKLFIQGEFSAKLYAPIPPIKAEIDNIIDKFDPLRQAIEAIVQRVEAAKAQLDTFSSIIAAFSFTIGNVLDYVASIGRKIKKWIDEKVAWLGWLLDSIEWVIDKALDLFGVDKLMDWIKEKLGNVPFVKEAREFLKLMKEATKEIQEKLDELIREIDIMKDKLEVALAGTFGFFNNETFQFIITIVVKKIGLEDRVPVLLQELIKELIRLGEMPELVEQPEGVEGEPMPEEAIAEERMIAISESMKNIEIMFTQLKGEALRSNTEFLTEEAEAIQSTVLEIMENLYLKSHTPRLAMSNRAEFKREIENNIQALRTLEEITKRIQERTSEFDRSYFDGLLEDTLIEKKQPEPFF